MKVLKHPLVLLLAVSSLASCRLVNNFMDNNRGCPRFFLNGQSPTVLQDVNIGNRYRQICQRYMGVDRFATLYDTVNKIPVYSAYLHIRHVPIPRPTYWRREPGLNRQASNRDYRNSGMQRGHLYGAYNNNNHVGVRATFTLTNAAPQNRNFNGQWYHLVEEPVNRLITANCGGNRGYIVTGVVPDRNRIIGNGVRVAGRFWTAYCCRDNNRNVLARGAYLMNQNGVLVLNIANVQVLENQLSIFYNIRRFQVFGGRC